MKVTYDPNGEMLYIELSKQYPFRTDTTSVPGLAILYDEAGRVCAIEIEDATTLVDKPNRVDFEYFAPDEEVTSEEEHRESA
ncbi:MAG: DUF2283 domain-containing protein [bacterium]|nr:DUF2283 domain-containing protein [bacterium]